MAVRDLDTALEPMTQRIASSACQVGEAWPQLRGDPRGLQTGLAVSRQRPSRHHLDRTQGLGEVDA